MLLPAITVAGAVLVIRRSATELKLTRPLARLFELFGSGVVLVTVAVSSISPAFCALNSTRIVSRPPAGITASVHVIVVSIVGPIGVAGRHTRPTPVGMIAVTVKLVLLMMRSVITTFCASEGPMLST